MSIETFYILLAVGAAFWLFRTKRQKPKASALPPIPTKVSPPEQPRPEIPADLFLGEVAEVKSQVDLQVKSETEARKRELEAQYAEDIKLRDRLSDFAKKHKLDKALVDLWESIQHYPSWSKREDFGKWNKLNLKGISGSKDGKISSVSFVDSDSKYTITEKSWSGMEGESYADFSFLENEEEMFAIGCSVNYGEYGSAYSCHRISAFKKRGNWAKLLLTLYGQIQIERGKSAAGIGYFNADEIKTRFEE